MEFMRQEDLKKEGPGSFAEKKVPFLENQEKIAEKIARLERIRNAISERLFKIEAKLENFGEENAEDLDYDEYIRIYGELDFAIPIVRALKDAELMQKVMELKKKFEKIRKKRQASFFKKQVKWRSFKINGN